MAERPARPHALAIFNELKVLETRHGSKSLARMHHLLGAALLEYETMNGMTPGSTLPEAGTNKPPQ